MKKFNGYNDYKRKKIKTPKLDSTSLKAHTACLQTLLEQSFVSLWGDYGKDVEQLTVSMSEYAQVLDTSTLTQQARHSLSHPVRQLKDHVNIRHYEGKIKEPKYSLIYDALKECYEPIVFDECQHVETAFKNRTERQRFLDGFDGVGVPLDQIR